MENAPPTGHCRRCGDCCRKSSPSLHLDDRALIEQGKLSLADVYTLRVGEFAFDTFRGGLTLLETELIKVREHGGLKRCVFFSPGESGCTVYSSRPIQCRTLECWNPSPLVRLFGSPKLERRHVVGDDRLRELIAAHEERTSFGTLSRLLDDYRDTGRGEKEILDLLNYDLFFRDFVAEKLSLDPSFLALYFGRPMIGCLRGFGYEVVGERESGYVLQNTGSPPQPRA